MHSGPRNHPSLIAQRAIGAVVGSAVGDALGAGYEFDGSGRFSSDHPSPLLTGPGEMRGGGAFGWAPGEFTDDTASAVALAESLLASDGFDASDLWRRWRAWAATASDVGILMGQALSHADHAGAAAAAEESNGGRSAGNGSLMRNVAVALFHHDDSPEDLSTLAAAQSALTHHDPDCAIACGLHARMVRAALHGDDAFGTLAEAIDELPADARQRWSALLGPDWKPSDAPAHLTNGTVWICMAQAVWAVRGARDFSDALIRAVDLGGDADTVACVAGSIAGARWGIQGIPSRWTTYVHGSLDTPDGRRTYVNADLQQLACRLIGIAPPPPVADGDGHGPVQVHDTLPVHASDWPGARRAPSDWAVISACRTGRDFHGRATRREVFLIDQYAETDNLDPRAALIDAVDAIDAFLAESPARGIVVHCHHGRSRTAFILKAWAMRRFGWDEPRAHEWLAARWPRATRENPVFQRILCNGWPERSVR